MVSAINWLYTEKKCVKLYRVETAYNTELSEAVIIFSASLLGVTLSYIETNSLRTNGPL